MPEVQFLDRKKYGRALWLLHYQIGGMFWSLPAHRLRISPGQYQALVAAGVLEPDREQAANGTEAKGRGPKKKK